MRDSIIDFIKKWWILALLILIKFTVQYFAVNSVYELHRDEFLHLDQANHLAAGFTSVPPFTSWISFLIKLLGGSVFWVRFFPALFGALTMVFVWLTVEQIQGSILSKILASSVFLFSVYARINILFQPNAFDILAWTAIFYLFIRFINENKNLWILIIVITYAIGFYNKYNVVFLLTGMLLALCLTPIRKIYVNKYLYFSFLIGLILLSPNLIWQYNHDFPVINHMMVLKSTQLDHVNRLDFLSGQLRALIGAVPLIIGSLIAVFRLNEFKRYKVIGVTFLIVLAIFTILRAKDYYAFGLYPVLMAIGAVYMEKLFHEKFKYIASLYIILNLALFISIAVYLLPVYSPNQIIEKKKQFEAIGLLRWEDGKNHQLPQDFSNMVGWKEMAEKTLSAYNQLPESSRKETIIFCDNYGQSGALNFYARGKIPEAYSFSTDYLFWIPDNILIHNVILIGNIPDLKIRKLFESVVKLDSVQNSFSRESGTSIILLQGAGKEFQDFFQKEVLQRRLKMDCF